MKTFDLADTVALDHDDPQEPTFRWRPLPLGGYLCAWAEEGAVEFLVVDHETCASWEVVVAEA